MTALAPSPAAPEPTSATASARAVIEGQMSMLTRLAQIGMEIAEATGRQAVAAALNAPAEAGDSALRSPELRAFTQDRDPGLAFARVARAVRMTIALQTRLLGDLAALDRGDRVDAAFAREERRMRLRRLVDQAAEATVTQARGAAGRDDAHAALADDWNGDTAEDEIERLSEEAYERLTDAEDDDLGDRPFAEIVAAICGDLGLSPDWTARLMLATGAATAPHGSPKTRADADTQNLLPLYGEGGAEALGWGPSGAHLSAAAQPPHPYPSPSRGGRETSHATLEEAAPVDPAPTAPSQGP